MASSYFRFVKNGRGGCFWEGYPTPEEEVIATQRGAVIEIFFLNSIIHPPATMTLPEAMKETPAPISADQNDDIVYKTGVVIVPGIPGTIVYEILGDDGTYRARRLGEAQYLKCTDELRAAVLADIEQKGSKG